MKKRLLAGFISVTLCAGLLAIPVSAEEPAEQAISTVSMMDEETDNASEELAPDVSGDEEMNESGAENVASENAASEEAEASDQEEIKETDAEEVAEDPAETENEIAGEEAEEIQETALTPISNVANVTLNVDIEYPPGSTATYEIVPDKTAFYTFKASSDGYTYGSIYQNNQKIGGEDGLSTGKGDFNFTICLEKGKSYQFRTGWASYRLGSYTVNVSRKIAIASDPVPCRVGIGGTANFSVSSDSGVKYQWQYSKDGVKWYNSSLASAKTKDLSFKVTTSNCNNMYRCVITYNGVSAATNAAIIDLIPPVKIVVQPQSVVAKTGDKAIFICMADFDEKYQWQYSKDGGASWYKSTAESANYTRFEITVSGTNKNNLYRCEVTGIDGNKKYSSPAGIIVATQLPVEVTANTGTSVSFTLEAAGITAYQWQYSKDEINWYNSSATGSKTKKLTIKVSDSNKDNVYRCKVTDSRGLTAFTKGMGIRKPALFTIDSFTDKIHFSNGARAPFMVTATGATSYQWQYSKDNGKTWYSSSATGAKTDYMVIVMSNSNKNNLYRCKVTGLGGSILYTDPVGFQMHQLYYGYEPTGEYSGMTSSHYVTCKICSQKFVEEPHIWNYPSEYASCTICGADKWPEEGISYKDVKSGSADANYFYSFSCAHTNGTMHFATFGGYVQYFCPDCGFSMKSLDTSILVGNM